MAKNPVRKVITIVTLKKCKRIPMGYVVGMGV